MSKGWTWIRWNALWHNGSIDLGNGKTRPRITHRLSVSWPNNRFSFGVFVFFFMFLNRPKKNFLSNFLYSRHANIRTLDTTHIPFKTENDLAVLICNSNVHHELSHSEYPTRHKQCAQALELMKLNSYKNATIKSLDGKLFCNLKSKSKTIAFSHFLPVSSIGKLFSKSYQERPVERKHFNNKIKK